MSQKALEFKTVAIICRVIDNFGDAGLVLRLLRAWTRQYPQTKLLVFSDTPGLFQNLWPYEAPWEILELEKDAARLASCTTIVQAFDAALSPEMEAVFFAPERSDERTMINLEYLSAEAWVPGFHKLPSLSGHKGVRKFFFMPGFTAGTGGLIWGDQPPPTSLIHQKPLKDLKQERRNLLKTLQNFTAADSDIEKNLEKDFWFLVFNYESDVSALVEALKTQSSCLALLLPGQGANSFIKAWEEAGQAFEILVLPFLPQDTFDTLLNLCNASLVRGEESLARACLSGNPFIWQAYKQDENYQKVKVEAFIKQLSNYFDPSVLKNLEALFQDFNDYSKNDKASLTDLWIHFFENYTKLQVSYQAFAQAFAGLPDCAKNLMEFIFS